MSKDDNQDIDMLKVKQYFIDLGRAFAANWATIAVFIIIVAVVGMKSYDNGIINGNNQMCKRFNGSLAMDNINGDNVYVCKHYNPIKKEMYSLKGVK